VKKSYIAAVDPGMMAGARSEITATAWLATLQLNHKMPDSLVARKMKTTGKHVKEIMGGEPTLYDLARMFHALGYELHIYTKNIATGKKEMRQPDLLPHALNHPHIRAQRKGQMLAKTTKSRR
jgi:hypothetical protein